eukprot:TRINITY_DN3328_c2_g1_i1.p1 TRINITY_DN3328_c2_g1~~TRINITY_DN3328_c2_g1_i1.p1  ORF type:complete len:173 (-),score=47.05 TRINITY_DN3328_c2_g1_i1:234-722(-)
MNSTFDQGFEAELDDTLQFDSLPKDQNFEDFEDFDFQTMDEDTQIKEDVQFIPALFCNDCSSLLQPYFENQKFLFKCGTCGNSQDAPNFVIYSKNTGTHSDAHKEEVKHLATDATLPRGFVYCKNCGTNRECVYEQNFISDDKVEYTYTCTHCNKRFTQETI